MASETRHASGSVGEYLAALQASPKFGPQVAHREDLAASSGRYRDVARPWPPELAAALAAMGIRFYTHQAQAMDHIRQGKHCLVATPTASGKSLIYNLPVFERVLAEPSARALYLFPLKALAQDQLKAVHELADHLPEDRRPQAVICDGDTSSYQRKKIRDTPPNILISNPDMLHLSLLGYHERWAAVWSGLTHVVLDEVHTYRGVFGSHMAWVLRRLQRICRMYGSAPQFLLSSATVGNPAQLARDLLGMPVELVLESGAPRGARHFILFDPYDSASAAAGNLLEAALKRGLRTIVYTQSRKMTELIYVWTRGRMGALRDTLTSYRAGFLPEDRREIEAKLASGELLGVISTSALELGIDIGDLDLCILVGYPGTIMATWQRSGRVGRRQHDSAIVLIGQEDALDQYFMRHPAELFRREVEAAVLNPGNRTILRKHLVCATAERPLRLDDPLLNEPAARAEAVAMAAAGELLLGVEGECYFTNRKYPHRGVNLRGGGMSFAIRRSADGELLGEIDGSRCLKECHPGAVYLHRGETWLVRELDLEGHEVLVTRRNVNYFTRTQGNKETEILAVDQEVELRNVRASFGTLRVTDTVTGYQRRLVRGQKVIGSEALDLPPQVFETEGLWIEISPVLQQRLEGRQVHFMGGIHAVEHACIGIFPLLVLCDRNDVGGIAYPLHPQLGRPAVFIYDGYPGGVGLARQAFGHIEELLTTALRVITDCPCEVGCPSCVHSPKCGSGNRPIDKTAARLVLEGLLAENDPDLDLTADFVSDRNLSHVVAAADKGPPGQAVAAPPLPSRYGVFDVETKRSAAEVGGWHLAERMGVSVAVLYDSGEDRFLTFRESELPQLIDHLRRLDLVVGFNNKRFDNRVLSAYSDFALHGLPTVDILEAVKNRLGYRLSLDALAEHTLGVQKEGDGLLALRWYQEGRFDLLSAYCRKDVEITRDLFRFAWDNGYLLFRNKAGHVVRCPVDFTW